MVGTKGNSAARGAERRQFILSLLMAKGQVTISEIASHFEVSEMTTRRDLDGLEAEGALRRVHGGATRVAGSSFEPPFAIRSHVNVDAKRRIARKVSELIVDGETVVLDGGSTGAAIAEALVAHEITVCTPSLRVADLLRDVPNIKLMLVGGTVRPGELSLVGPGAIRTLEDHRFDVFVMSVSGLDASAGCTEWNVDDAAVKRTALNVASRCIVAADVSKVGAVAFARVCGIDDIDHIVTDSSLDSASADALRALGVTIHIV